MAWKWIQISLYTLNGKVIKCTMFSHKSSNVTDDSSASLAQRERIDGSEICTQGMLLIIYTQYEKINVMI